MSSVYVRSQILDFLSDELPAEKTIDLTAEFQEIEDLVNTAGITIDDPWLGVQFLGFEELPIDIQASNTKGTYRELGSITLHVVEIARLGVHTVILSRAEAIRNKFRGQRIGSILIESVSPASFGTGVTLSFEGGYTSASISIDYQYDRNL